MILYRILYIILLTTLVDANSTEVKPPTPPTEPTSPPTPATSPPTAVSTTTAKSTTTTIDPITEQDIAVTEKLLDILAQYNNGEAHGNRELKSWLNFVKEASKFGKNRLVDKVHAVVLFNQYDHSRKDLEEQIHDRLDIIVDELIPSQKPYSECWKFYIRQRNALRKALKKTNSQKALILQQNSVACTIPDSSEEDDD